VLPPVVTPDSQPPVPKSCKASTADLSPMVFSDTGKNIGCLITVSKCGAVRFDDEIFRHDQHGDGGKRDCKAFGDAEPGGKDRLNIAPGVCRRSSERMPECHLSHWQSHVTPLRDPLPF
jgi:hypothetical protein